jgi:hypothetical protein
MSQLLQRKCAKRNLSHLLGTCPDCGQPVTEAQEFIRSEDGIRHALCVFDPAFAKHVRELGPEKGK